MIKISPSILSCDYSKMGEEFENMKTVLINQPGEIKVTEIPMPEVKEGEALLKIRYCGICGADVASYTGNQPFTTYPRIPGHEFSAEIVTVPENNLGLKPGDIVNKALDNGLIVITAGSNVVRMVPPLVITKAHVDEMIEKLQKSL